MIEEFLTGRTRQRTPERTLATVLFTDLVGSTDRAARLATALGAGCSSATTSLCATASNGSRTRGQDARRRFRGHLRRPDTRGPLCAGDRGGPGHTWTTDQVRVAHRRVRAVERRHRRYRRAHRRARLRAGPRPRGTRVEHRQGPCGRLFAGVRRSGCPPAPRRSGRVAAIRAQVRQRGAAAPDSAVCARRRGAEPSVAAEKMR